MADTGWKSPTATGGTHNDYTNPTNAYSSNNNYATRLMADGSTYRQSYSDFAFGIPAGATINGIEMSIEGYGSVQISLPHYIYSTSASGTGTKYKTYLVSPGDTEVEGGPTDLWSKTWIATDFFGRKLLYVSSD